MITSERYPQNLSEAILTLLAPCEGIVKFSHTLLVCMSHELMNNSSTQI